MADRRIPALMGRTDPQGKALVAPVAMPAVAPVVGPRARVNNHAGEPGFRAAPPVIDKPAVTGPRARPVISPKPRQNNHAGEPGYRAAQGKPAVPKTAAAKTTKAVTDATKASKAAPKGTVKGSKLVAEARAAAAANTETRAQHQQRLALERMLKASRKG